MKRERQTWQDDDEERKRELERESKRSRMTSAIEAMNRVAKERKCEQELKEREQQEMQRQQFVPTFLRSLVAPSSSSSSSSFFTTPLSEEERKSEIAWEQWRRQQEQEEKEEVAAEEEKKKVSVVPIYHRLFQQPRQRIFDRPERLLMNDDEKKFYLEGLSELSEGGGGVSTDLANLIYQYNISEEIGTPLEFCYRQTNDNSQSSCIANVIELKKILDSSKTKEIPFETIKCALYCLLKNLPTFVFVYNLVANKSLWEPFEFSIAIYPNTKINAGSGASIDAGMYLDISIRYDEGKADYLVFLSRLPIVYNFNDTKPVIRGFISLDDAIDLLFQYGSTNPIFYSFPRYSNFQIKGFRYKSSSDPHLWEIIMNNSGIGMIFETYASRF
jgi:hypothetical protein